MHAPSLAAFAAMVLVAGGVVAGIGYPPSHSQLRFDPFPAQPIQIPLPSVDADLDGYADSRDLVDGDLLLWLNVTGVDVGHGGHARPYLVVGTQDDQWRLGAGAQLEWRHVVDFDPLGHKAGSPAWEAQAIRTGVWWPSQGDTPGSPVLGSSGRLGTSAQPDDGGALPQAFPVNVRDDKTRVTLHVELWDEAQQPDRLMGTWDLAYDVADQVWGLAPEAAWLAGEVATLSAGAASVELTVEAGVELPAAERLALARAWAPHLFFDQDEEFFPTAGEALESFHGFTKRPANLRTWDPTFNDGRDGYRLMVADFNGDRVTDHRDVVIMTDVLRAGGKAQDTVYVQATTAHNGQFVLQYWFIYAYNFVSDEGGQDIAALAHAGDREFMQLVFESPSQAANGFPSSVAYSQHYRGVVIDQPAPGAPPFHLDPRHPSVYPARGAHASYPVPGDDQKLRSSLAGYGDRFDGLGENWTLDDYDLQLLSTQQWHLGYKWGPLTRYARDLGISLKPLLQHDFRYPFADPLHWQGRLPVVAADELMDLYRTPEASR